MRSGFVGLFCILMMYSDIFYLVSGLYFYSYGFYVLFVYPNLVVVLVQSRLSIVDLATLSSDSTSTH